MHALAHIKGSILGEGRLHPCLIFMANPCRSYATPSSGAVTSGAVTTPTSGAVITPTSGAVAYGGRSQLASYATPSSGAVTSGAVTTPTSGAVAYGRRSLLATYGCTPYNHRMP